MLTMFFSLLLPTLAMAAPAIPQLSALGTITAAVKDLSAPRLSSQSTAIEFTTCHSVGSVSGITISPCQGGNGTFASPCEFHFKSNYTITLNFTSTIGSTLPRSNLIAHDGTESLGAGYDHFPYSGQSFDGCEYTTCPVPADTPATYTYVFRTLRSQFDALTFNVTDTLAGPSFLCASFPVKLVLDS